MINPYFNLYKATNEQNLVESLLIEAIRIYGIDVIYLPRERQREDLILGEDYLSKFTKTYEVEMYMKSYDSFGGQGEFISKFGLEIEDVMTLVVSQSVFENVTSGEYTNPREGDLVYFPLNKVMFEIKYVDTEKPFYQTGKLFLYEIKLEKFRFANQEITTGDPDIDRDYLDNMVYSINFVMGTGTGNYTIGEPVYQGPNLAGATAKGEVITWDETAKVAKIKFIAGLFEPGTAVVGNTSGASYSLTSFDMQDPQTQHIMSDNKELQTESNAGVTDKTERNPFGDY